MTALVLCGRTLALAALPVIGLAQSTAPAPSPTPQPGQAVLQQGVAPPARSGPVRVGAKVAPTADSTRSFEGDLAGIRALQIVEGEARVILGGGERVVTPGTVLGTDTVKSITPGRIVLRRVAPEDQGGEGIVIVSFDAQGRTRVQVFASKDPTAKAAPEVK
jgi:hypothetical protein